MLFSFVKISYNQKPSGLLRWVPFIKTTLGAVALTTLTAASSYGIACEDMPQSHSYMYYHQVWWL